MVLLPLMRTSVDVASDVAVEKAWIGGHVGKMHNVKSCLLA